MNELEIKAELDALEQDAANLYKRLCKLGVGAAKFAEDNGHSPYAISPAIDAHADAVSDAGKAVMAIRLFHDAIAPFAKTREGHLHRVANDPSSIKGQPQQILVEVAESAP